MRTQATLIEDNDEERKQISSSQPYKLNFGGYLNQMLQEELIDQGKISSSQSVGDVDIFKKKPFLNIEMLQTRGTQHLLMNKTSDKFTRRDVQFYDMYIKRETTDELARLKDA